MSANKEALWEERIDGRVFSIRRARHEDYEAVLNIDRDVHYGSDFIPTFFHSLLQDADYTMLVMTCEGCIMVFGGLGIVDAGTIAVVTGRRVHEDYRSVRPHPMLLLDEAALRLVKSKVPSLQFCRTVTRLTQSVASYLSSSTAKDRMIKQWGINCSITTKERLLTALDNSTASPTVPVVERPTWASLDNIFHSHVNQEHLFPDGNIIVNFKWTPYKVSTASLKMIVRENVTFVTLKGGEHEQKDESACNAVTFVNVFRSIKGIAAAVFYYGRVDEALLKSHLLVALRYIAGESHDGRQININTNFPNAFGLESVNEFISLFLTSVSDVHGGVLMERAV